MWILTVKYNDEETFRILRVNSLVNVGRSYEYKADPSSVYIGDLKVPKKYITITVGKCDLDSDERSPLSIKFDSICTTSVNGTIYKLASRDADPIIEQFHEDKLILKVNSNKSDRIQLHLTWCPVLVLTFSKRILFEGEIQPSPLPDKISSLHSQGIDLRVVKDPLLATYYLTMSDYLDYNLEIAVLRGIPVVSPKWAEFLETNSDDVQQWLEPLAELLLQGTDHDYVFPNSSRRLLLDGFTTIIYGRGPQKQLSRLEKWLNCLCASKVVILDPSADKAAIAKVIQDEFATTGYIFTCIDNDPGLEVFGSCINTMTDLWKTVVDVNISVLKLFDRNNLPELEPSMKADPDSLRLTQRRKRRKVERVNDTDFFLFSQVTSSQPVPDSLVDSQGISNVPRAETEGNNKNERTKKMSEENNIIEVPNDNSKDKDEKEREENNIEAIADIKIVENEMENENLNRKDEIEAATKLEEPQVKKAKKSNSEWIVPQVSLAEAVQSMKKQADDEVKKELGFDEINGDLKNLVIVEEIDMTRKQPRVSTNEPSYSGRKNFKAFKKKLQTHNVTRTYLELHDDNAATEIRFAELPMVEKTATVEQEFSKEMDNVKGYQPEPSQLFVNEASEDETSFSFLEKAKKRDVDSDDDDDEFAFKFSRT